MEHKANYCHTGYLRHVIPTSQLAKTARQAACILRRFDFDTIAFRGMSGALIAPILALRLNKSLIMVRKPNDNTHSELLVEGDKAAKRYIIVDDFQSSGATASTIKFHIERFAPQAECLGVFETFHMREQYNEYRAGERGLNPIRKFMTSEMKEVLQREEEVKDSNEIRKLLAQSKQPYAALPVNAALPVTSPFFAIGLGSFGTVTTTAAV